MLDSDRWLEPAVSHGHHHRAGTYMEHLLCALTVYQTEFSHFTWMVFTLQQEQPYFSALVIIIIFFFKELAYTKILVSGVLPEIQPGVFLHVRKLRHREAK